MLAERHAAAPRVLLVEDDRDIREVMQAGLEDAGLAVTAVADGERALNWARRQRPAVVVLALRLPGMAGEELARRLRSQPGAAPPVVVTAVADPQEQTERAGGLLYLRKPFEITELVTAVRADLSAVSPAGPG